MRFILLLVGMSMCITSYGQYDSPVHHKTCAAETDSELQIECTNSMIVDFVKNELKALECREANRTEFVTMSFEVGSSGLIGDLKFEEGASCYEAVKSAFRVLSRNLVFTPARNDSQPVSSRKRITIEFDRSSFSNSDTDEVEPDILPKGENSYNRYVNAIYKVTDESPRFNFCDTDACSKNELKRYIRDNKRISAEMNRTRFKGKSYVQFIVERNGTVSDLKVVRGFGGDYDKEIIRLVRMMPPWRPAYQDGQKVRFLYTLPVVFGFK